MTNYNWKTFTRRITINREREIIYRAWTTQAGLENWFLRLAEFTKPDGRLRSRNEAIQKGDTYKWLWFGYDDSVVEEKEILEANDNDMLQFSFSGGCIVTVTVKEEQGENICELVQEMPMDDEVNKDIFTSNVVKAGHFIWQILNQYLKAVLICGIKKWGYKT